MADPVLKKITALELIDSAAAADVIPVVDISEVNTSLQNKKIRIDQLKVFSANQMGADVVETTSVKDKAITNAKLADLTITNDKLASINKTLIVRLTMSDEPVTLRTWTNEFPWTPDLNGLVIKEAYATLGAVSSSGNVVIVVKNNGNTVTTLTVSPGARNSPAGTIEESYRTITQFQSPSFQVTATGTNAKGLSVVLIVGRA